MKDFDRLDELFGRALALDPEDRERWVAGLAADDAATATALRELLACHETASHLDEPASLGPDAVPAVACDPRALENETVGGFRILRHLGSGGMSDVFEAEQDTPRRRIALKALRAASHGSTLLRRFMIEVEALANVDHPHVAKIHGGGLWPQEGDPWVAWYAMELIEEPAGIVEFADRHGLDRDARIELLLPACDAVHHAHRRGFLHRDLKPANLLVSLRENAPAVKVIDFGVSRIMGSVGADALHSTQAGELLGTPRYMSPEQAAGRLERLDVRTDVYSLGVVLFELLCRRHPLDLDGASVFEALARIRGGAARDPRTVDPSIPEDLAAVMLRALAHDPEDRYDSARALADDLERFLASAPVYARRGGFWHQLRLLARRRRRLFVAAACVLGAALVSFTLIVFLWIRSENALERYRAARTAAAEQEERVAAARTELGQLRDVLDDALANTKARRAAAESVVRSSSERLASTRSRGAARRVVAEAYARLRQLDPILSGDDSGRSALAAAYERVGDLHGSEWFAGPDDARTGCVAFGRAVELRRARSISAPDATARIELVNALCLWVQALRKTNQHSVGAAPADEAVGVARALVLEEPGDNERAGKLLSALWARSDLCIGLRSERQGVADALAALEVAEEALGRAPRDRSWRSTVAWAEFRVGIWLENSDGDRADTVRRIRRAADELLALWKEERSGRERLGVLTILSYEIAMLQRFGEKGEALVRARRGLAATATPRERPVARDLEVWTRFAVLALSLGSPEERDALAKEIDARWSEVSDTELCDLRDPAGTAAELLDAGLRAGPGLRPLFTHALERLTAERDGATSPEERRGLQQAAGRLRAALDSD